MSPMLKWALVAFGIGIVIVIADIHMARKKKGGMDAADKQRIWSIFWFSWFAAAGTAALIWLASD